MKRSKFNYTIDYDIEAEDEEDAIYTLVDLIKQDWPYYIDEGELKEVEKVEAK